MTRKISISIDETIKHWSRNSKVRRIENIKIGQEHCALCGLVENQLILPCWGCPIALKTGKMQCRGTPFYDALEAFNNDDLTENLRNMLKE